MLRVFQEDKITVTHFYPGQDQLLWRPIHRFLFRSFKTRSYGYNNAAFLKLENESFQNVTHSGNRLYRTRLDGKPIRKKRFWIQNVSVRFDEAW